MTDSDQVVDAIERATADLIPQLAERLERYGLGEIEVTHGDLRLRVRSGTRMATAAPAAAYGSASASSAVPTPPPIPAERSGMGVVSPAVGFFMYAERLGPGLDVDKGDALGHVEMLGVRHDVRAPRRGTVRHLVAESGEAVEYGQIVVELEPAEASAR